MSPGVGWAGLAISLLFVMAAVVLSGRLGLGLGRSMVTATGLSLVQLVIVGIALGFVIAPEQPLVWSWIWVAAILVLAAWIISRRVPEVPGLFRVALLANIVTGGIAIAIVFGLGIFPLEGRTLIPVVGMTVGNTLTATVVAGSLLVTRMSERRDEVEARLALGLPWRAASLHEVREVLRAAISPQIERTRNVGTIFLPGAMVGLILAGVEPIDAVLVQAALMYVILGSVAVSTVVITIGATRALFTPDHRLMPIARRTPPRESPSTRARVLATWARIRRRR
jgi:putative ABC transport system permease protein